MPAIANAQIGQFELEVELDVAPDRAWRALTAEIDAWWLPDFRAAGEKSVVKLDLEPGGALLETNPDGTALVWYTVQMIKPGRALYLVGHTAKDWGGPTISMLKLELTPRTGGSLLKISDSLVGNVGTSELASIGEGWLNLFGSGLKSHLATARP